MALCIHLLSRYPTIEHHRDDSRPSLLMFSFITFESRLVIDYLVLNLSLHIFMNSKIKHKSNESSLNQPANKRDSKQTLFPYFHFERYFF